MGDGEPRTWFEDDAFWHAVASSLFGDEAWESAAAESIHLGPLLDIEEGSAVLDLGCGPGRYAVPLARRGVRVTAVDRTAGFIEELRSRSAEADLQMDPVCADMRDFRRHSAFDAAISMLTSFGYFEDPEDDLRVLRNVLESLKPGGRFLIDTIGKEVLGRIFQARDWKEIGGEVWLFERRPVRAWSWMEGTWIRIHDGERQVFDIGHRLFSAAELTQLALEAGFAEASAFGDLEGSPYDETSNRLVVVAVKED